MCVFVCQDYVNLKMEVSNLICGKRGIKFTTQISQARVSMSDIHGRHRKEKSRTRRGDGDTVCFFSKHFTATGLLLLIDPTQC